MSGSYRSSSSGRGVAVYIVDTGISPHDEFGDRLAPGVDLVGDGRGTTDCDGHGTHVAGTVGGATVGVANEVTLVPVRVLDCGGRTDLQGMMRALDWIAANHPPGTPGVVNASLGGGNADSLQRMVDALLVKGLTFIKSAGNKGKDACGETGVGLMGSIVVGWTDENDIRASGSNGSNYGPCVDLFAPGELIRSASHLSPSETVFIDPNGFPFSGTSMAAPHVAGAAAVLLSQNPSLRPADVETLMLGAATPAVGNPGPGSPNLLLYVDPDGLAAPPEELLTPPPDQVAVLGTTEEVRAQVENAALAVTGGDPRALLALGLTLLLSGAVAIIGARRREVRAQLIASRSFAQFPPSGLQLLPRTRH